MLAQIRPINTVTKEDVQTLKLLFCYDKFNPQKFHIHQSNQTPIHQDRIICLYSPSLVNILILKYLLFFRNPQNDRFTQLIETQINKTSDHELKRKITHSLMIFTQVVSKNLEFYLRRTSEKQLKGHCTQRLKQQALQKSLNQNLSTLKVNKEVILSLTEFLQFSSVGLKLQDIVFNWIKELSAKIVSTKNQKLIKYSKSQYQPFNKEASYLIEFGNITQEILAIFRCKEGSKNDRHRQSFAHKGCPQQNCNRKGFKLMLFPNKNTLATYIQNWKVKKEEQSKDTLYETSQTDRGLFETDEKGFGERVQIDDKFRDQKKVQKINPQLIKTQIRQKEPTKAETTHESKTHKFQNFLNFLLLFTIITLLVFGYHFPENPFIVKASQFSYELSQVMIFVTFELLEAFFLFNLKLIYPHDCNINNLDNP